MNKVEELVEWVAEQMWNNFVRYHEEQRLYVVAPNPDWKVLKEKYPKGLGVRTTYVLTKRLLSHPDLALIDRENTLFENQYSIIPLAEALKEATDESN